MNLKQSTPHCSDAITKSKTRLALKTEKNKTFTKEVSVKLKQ